MQRMSIFQPYFLGHAAENLQSGDVDLEIFPTELLTTIEGSITPVTETIVTAGIDGDGDIYTDAVNQGNTIKAEWLGGGNSLLAPDVRRAERVIVYRVGDSPHLYWRTLGKDQNLRRLETIIIAVSANPSNKDQEKPTPENSYYLEVNTHQGFINFSTSQINGEKAAFLYQMNTKEGYIQLEDEKGNYFHWDSVNTRWIHQNTDNSFIEVHKKIINMNAEDKINVHCDFFNLTADEEINFITKRFNMKASESVTIDTKATTLTSTDTIDFKTTTFTMVASGGAEITAPLTKFNGKVLVSETVTAIGAILGLSIAAGAPGAPPMGEMRSSGILDVPGIKAKIGSFSGLVESNVVQGSVVKTNALLAPEAGITAGAGPSGGFTSAVS